MSARQWQQSMSAVMIGVLLALIVRYVFLRCATIIVLFAIGALIAWLIDPLLDAMQRRGLKRIIAVWIVILGIVLLIAAVGLIVVPRLIGQVQDVAVHWRDYLTTAQTSYEQWRHELERYLKEKYPEAEIVPLLDNWVQQATSWLSNNIPTVLQWLSQKLIASVGVLGLGFFLLVISFHFMMIIDPLRESVRRMLPQEAGVEMSELEAQINAMLGQYLRGIFVVSICYGAAVVAVLSVVSIFWGTKYALVIGLIAGLTCMIPYFGPLLMSLAAGFFGYVTAVDSPWIAAIVSIAAVLLVNQTFDMLITPRIVGQRVGLHPLIVLFALFAGMSLLGVPGMIIATPVAASVKLILARWLPVKEVDFTAPVRKRRVEIDMHASVRLLREQLARLGREIEALGAAARHEEDIKKQEEITPSAAVQTRGTESVNAADKAATTEEGLSERPAAGN